MGYSLADDLLLMSTGNQSLNNFEYAYNLTHKHLEDMGAKVAPKKCTTFSSSAANRKWLKQNKWRRLGTTVNVVTDMRDLRAHLNAAGARLSGATLTRRMRTVRTATMRLGRMKAPYDKVAAIVRAKLIPKGLYGCESCPVNDAALRTWRAEVANAATFVTTRRSADLTFATASHGADIDPEVHVYTKRAMGMRRAYHVSGANRKLIEGNFQNVPRSRRTRHS